MTEQEKTLLDALEARGNRDLFIKLADSIENRDGKAVERPVAMCIVPAVVVEEPLEPAEPVYAVLKPDEQIELDALQAIAENNGYTDEDVAAYRMLAGRLNEKYGLPIDTELVVPIPEPVVIEKVKPPIIVREPVGQISVEP